jgi:hypothetical protein
MKNIRKERDMRKDLKVAAAAVALFVFQEVALAGAPTLIPVQGVLTDSSDQPVNGVKSMKFLLYTAETGGSPIWYETQIVVVAGGFFTAYLGDVTALNLLLFKDNSNLWLGIKVDAGQELAPRTYLGSAPYTAFAEYCGNAPPHTHGFTDIPSAIARTDQSNTYTGGQSMPTASFTAAAGTAPFSVVSDTKVSNLNSDLLDGLSASAFAQSSHAHGYPDLPLTIARIDMSNTFAAGQTVSTGGASSVGLAVTGAAGQTANLSEWRDSAQAVKASMGPHGVLTAAGIATAGNVSAGTFAGNGADITSINPSNVAAGTFSAGLGFGGAATFNSTVTVSGAAGSLSVSSASAAVFSNRPSFAVSSGAPFTVTSTARVTNLNADKAGSADQAANADTLDGRHASDFTAARAPSPMQIALRRWYEANTSGVAFAAGDGPTSVEFDGANIWVGNRDSSNVTKLRANDGSLAGTYSAGNGAYGMAFDGANIWVSNHYDDLVTKIKASDGSFVGAYGVGNEPHGVAFDGANIWVASKFDGTLTKRKANNGSLVGTYTVGASLWGVCFDGTYIWVADRGGESVKRILPSNGSVAGTYTVGSAPVAVAFDGANIWVANSNSDNVTKLRASDGTLLGTYAVGDYPSGLVFDGVNIWVANANSGTVTKLRAADGSLVDTYTVGSTPLGMAFDGANIWVANFGSNTVSKM